MSTRTDVVEDTECLSNESLVELATTSGSGTHKHDAFLQPVFQDSDVSGPGSSSCSGVLSGSSVSSYCRIGGLLGDGSNTAILFNCGDGGEKEAITQTTNAERQSSECPFCHREFRNRFTFKVHLQSHTGKPYQCMICGRAFAQKGNVKKHIEQHKVYPHMTTQREKTDIPATSERSEQPDGGVLFVQLDGNVNVKRKDTCNEIRRSADIAYRCPYCTDLFHCYSCLKSHLPSHKDKKVFQCPLRTCYQLYPKLEEFMAHLTCHRDSMTYDCPICGRTFQSLSDVGFHQCAHVIANEKRSLVKKSYRCMECGDIFKSLHSLERHYAQTTHRYRCIKCKRVYASARRLRTHLKSHQNTAKLMCSVCGRVYSYAWSLKLHVNSAHGQMETHFSCSHCSKTFKRRDVLRRHEASVHSADSRFPCTFDGCSKMFKRLDRLKEHVLTHYEVKKYNCTTCGKLFTRHQAYKMHVRSVHEKQYKYSCGTCKKGFNRPDKFERHKKRCQSEKEK